MAFQYDAQHKKHNIVFILESNFHAIKNNSAKELVQNIAEYQIGNLNTMGYDVMVSISEDVTISKLIDQYDYAVVFTPDTEFQENRFFNIYTN